MWDNRSMYIRNYDGDTITYESDMGRHISHQADIRLLGVFAPEVSKKEPGAIETRDFVRDWHVERIGRSKWPFLVTTALVWAEDPDKSEAKTTLERYVATVTCIATNEVLNVAVAEFIRKNNYGPGIL